MKKWVVGFLFDLERKSVLLIQKNRPVWQSGLLNGVGGHVKEYESPIHAMIREFKEETGVEFRGWRPVAVFEGLDGAEDACECFFFYGLAVAEKFREPRTMTDERLVRVSIRDLSDLSLVKNLYWLIPMCLDTGLTKPVWFGGMYPK